MADTPAVPFRVVRSEQIRHQLTGWGKRAKALGLAAGFAAALRFIEDILMSDPLGWGDPAYRFQALELEMCRGTHWKILVEYGVNKAKRVVFIKSYELTPDNPLLSSSDAASPNGSS